MITDLPDFIEKLRDNQLWWQRMLEMYPTKDHLQITKEMHTWLLASPERLHAEDWADFRRLYQSFCKNSKTEIKVVVKAVESIPEPVEVRPEDQPLTGEARAARIKELLEAIKGVQTQNAYPPLTHEQILNEGGWLPKKEKPHPSAPVSYVKHWELHLQYIRENYEPNFTNVKRPGWISEEEWLEQKLKDL